MNEKATVENLPPPALREAIAALWRLRPPGPPDLYKAPEFIHLCQTCSTLYANAPSGNFEVSALHNALYALGFPGRPQLLDPELIPPDGLAATRLHAAFERREARRRYLCPLDMADDLPALTFGPNRIGQFTAAELEALVDQPRLRRINPIRTFDADRLSEFRWLVIEKMHPLDQPPGKRANSDLFKLLSTPMEQLDAIKPHCGRFPPPGEDALFAILLAPWEDWVDRGAFWQPFWVPWCYGVDDDIFVLPEPPPSPDTLSWEPAFNDEEEVSEQPVRIFLKETKIGAWLNEDCWGDIVTARKSRLFKKTPVVHFFVKAFVEEPLGEFLAHMLKIEAALGLESDYPRKGQPRSKRGATKLMKARVSALLGENREGTEYCRLFNFRSKFLHGRDMGGIPPKARRAARRLARKVVCNLIKDALEHPLREDRDAYLNALAK